MKGDEFKVDFRVRRLDTGEMRWLHARARAIMDEKGRPEKLIGINMDKPTASVRRRKVRKDERRAGGEGRDRTQELETVYTSLQRSEARYKDLFNQANDVIFTTDSEGRITSANRKAAEVFLPGKPVQHLSIGDLLTPESAGRAADVLRRAVAANSDLPDEQPSGFEAWTKDGNLVSLEVHGALYARGRVITGIHGIARDVTQRKKMQEEMAKLLSAVEHAGDGIFMLSPDRRYTYVNPAFARMYGYTADEMVGSSPVMTRSDATPIRSTRPSFRAACREYMDRAPDPKENKTARLVEMRRPCADSRRVRDDHPVCRGRQGHHETTGDRAAAPPDT